MSKENKNIKFIFIINDAERRALHFISRYKITKKRGHVTISFDKTKDYRDVNFAGLINYRHCYRLDKILFFDDCTFGKTNNLSGKG